MTDWAKIEAEWARRDARIVTPEEERLTEEYDHRPTWGNRWAVLNLAAISIEYTRDDWREGPTLVDHLGNMIASGEEVFQHIDEKDIRRPRSGIRASTVGFDCLISHLMKPWKVPFAALEDMVTTHGIRQYFAEAKTHFDDFDLVMRWPIDRFQEIVSLTWIGMRGDKRYEHTIDVNWSGRPMDAIDALLAILKMAVV